jgi:hypothetical protein
MEHKWKSGAWKWSVRLVTRTVTCSYTTGPVRAQQSRGSTNGRRLDKCPCTQGSLYAMLRETLVHVLRVSRRPQLGCGAFRCQGARTLGQGSLYAWGGWDPCPSPCAQACPCTRTRVRLRDGRLHSTHTATTPHTLDPALDAILGWSTVAAAGYTVVLKDSQIPASAERPHRRVTVRSVPDPIRLRRVP